MSTNSTRLSTDRKRFSGASFRPAALLFVLLLLIVSALFGCGGAEQPEETRAPTPVPKYSFAEGGLTDYAIVRGDDASDAVVKAAAALRKALSEKTGAQFKLYDEFSYARAPEPHAIVVGALGKNAAEAGIISELSDGLLINDYLITAKAGELFFLGGSDNAVREAVEWFIANLPLTEDGDLILESGYAAKFTDSYRLPDVNFAGETIRNLSIVYGPSDSAKKLAGELKTLLGEECGINASLVSEQNYSSGQAIFVGTAKYSQQNVDYNPNAEFRISSPDGNLVFSVAGPRTCDSAYKAFENLLKADADFAASPDLSTVRLAGDVTDGREYRLIGRSEGTFVRVLHSNVLISSDKFTDSERAELLADTYKCYAPDVVTLNEFIYNRGITNAISSRLAGLYTAVEAPYIKLYPDPANPDAAMSARRYATPVLYRNDSGLTLIDSGFSYLSDMISYHGWSYAVFEKDGSRFCVFSAHFSDNRDSGVWHDRFAREVLNAVSLVREKHGAELPVVIAGDFYFWPGSLPYSTFIAAGYKDAATTAEKAYSDGIGTFHTVGEGSTGGAIEDLIFYSSGLRALAHRVVVDKYTVNGSDHYPVVADFALGG